MSYREYCVVIKKGEDLTALEQELTAPSGNNIIPNRSVTISDPKPGSKRITRFILTDDEAQALQQDLRIEAVEIPAEQNPDVFIELDAVTPYTQSGNFQMYPNPLTFDFKNWGPYHASFEDNPYNGADPGTIRSYTSHRDGTGVDVVIMDSGIDPDHPEWEDYDGNSRLRQIDWYEASGLSGNMPFQHYTDYDGHGTHVASTIAGKEFGFLKNADIYAIKSLPSGSDPNGGISISSSFDLIRLWHVRKNDPNDTIYTGRPTVVNMSWGSQLRLTTTPTSGFYRGVSWTYGDPGYSTEQELWDNVGLVPKNGSGQNVIPFNNSTYNAELQDMADTPGMVVCVSAGNRSNKSEVPSGPDYNNTINFTNATNVFYHRPGSPYSPDTFSVGSFGYTQGSILGVDYNQPSFFSERGPGVNIWAAGYWIMAASSSESSRTDYTYLGITGSPHGMYLNAGTSMATPNVSGVVGQHMQTQRSLTFSEASARILAADAKFTIYDEGDTTAYSGTLTQLLGSQGNTLVSRYSNDVSTSKDEFLDNITISTSSNNVTAVSTPAEFDVRPFLSNVSVANLKTLTITQQPTNGTATVTDNLLGIITYSPNTNYTGTDLFSYTVENNLSNVSTVGSVSFSVGGDAGMRFLTPDYVEVTQGTTEINVLANDDFANASISTVFINSAPSKGVAVADPLTGNIFYTPNIDVLTEKDEFTYFVEGNDGFTNSETAYIAIQQALAVTNFSIEADTNEGTITIPVLDSLSSYDPYPGNTHLHFNFSGANPLENKVNPVLSANIAGDIVLGQNHNVVSNVGHYDFNSLHFGPNRVLSTESTVDVLGLPPNFLSEREFTIEFDFINNSSNLPGLEHLMGDSSTSNYGFRVFFNTGGSTGTILQLMFPRLNGSSQTGISFEINLFEWYHVAVQRVGDNYYGYLNGELKVVRARFDNYDDLISPLYLGGWPSSGSNTRVENAYIDNIRFTTGTRYPLNSFPPRNQRYPTTEFETADPQTISIQGAPEHGTAILTSSGIEYTPTPGYVGPDYIEFNIKNSVTGLGEVTSQNANISINVFTSVIPTYSNLLVSPNSVNEDGTTVTYTLNTENVLDGTTISYTISGTGITTNDISLANLTGFFVVNSNVGTLSFDVLADNFTEGPEILTLTLGATDSNGDSTGALASAVTINDTSLSAPGYSSANFNYISANEDGTTLVRFIVNTTSILDGTTVGYTFSGTGITSNDISVPLTGNITITSDTGSVDFYIQADNFTEGTEVLVGQLDATDSNSNPTGSLSDNLTINDTSLTLGSYDAAYFNLPSVNEDGSTLVIFTVETSNVIDDTSVGYQIGGLDITVDDISLISLAGNVEINSNTATLSFTVNADSVTEGNETLTITLAPNDSAGNPTGEIANSIILTDTSVSLPPGTPTYNTVNFNTISVQEDGAEVVLNVITTDVTPGTFVEFTISGAGITADDISLPNLTGTVINNGNVSTTTFNILQDFLTEGDETLTVTLAPTDSNGDATGSLSASLTILDTSKTPAYLSASFDVAAITENNIDLATFTVLTQNVLPNTEVGYTITGVTTNDISIQLTGNIFINNNTGNVSFTAIADSTTEAVEAAIITLAPTDSIGTITGSLSDSVLIIDTSGDITDNPITSDISSSTVMRQDAFINVAPFISDPDFGEITALTVVSAPTDGNVVTEFNTKIPFLQHQLDNPDSGSPIFDGSSFNFSSKEFSKDALAITDFYTLVGSPLKDDKTSGSNHGEAYLFNTQSGALIRTFTNTGTQDFFGCAVDLTDQYLVIGARGSDAAYIHDTASGVRLHTLTDLPGGNSFGAAAAISNNYTVVGAPTADTQNGLSSGKAYIFNTVTGALLHTLDNPNYIGTETDDKFGSRIATTNSYTVIGVPRDGDPPPVFGADGGSGVAYIYNPATGALIHTLTNPNSAGGVAGDQFGDAVAITNSYTIVGAWGEDEVGGSSDSGKAYIFNTVTGALLHTLDNPGTDNGVIGDNFGKSVAISNKYAIVGAPNDSSDYSGRAYVFSSLTGEFLFTLDNPNPVEFQFNNQFGNNIAISDNWMAIGAPKVEAQPEDETSGKVYLYNFVLNAAFIYSPFPNFSGEDVISYSVTDDDGLVSNTSNVYITVFAVPIANEDNIFTDENTSITYNIIDNDIPGENQLDPSTVIIVDSPIHGTVTNFNNGLITYTPTPGYSGSDLLTYTVSDFAGGISYPANVNIVVFPNSVSPNVPPTAVDDSAYVGANGTVRINVLDNDTDIEDTLDGNSIIVTTFPVSGTAEVVPAEGLALGYIIYTPNLGYTGVDTFAYTVADSRGLRSDPANVTVNVLSGPTAIPDVKTTIRNTPVSISVPGNDIPGDANINLSSVVITTSPENGLAVVNNITNDIDYTPNTNFVGTDILFYSIADEFGITGEPASVTITVEQAPATGVPEFESIQFVQSHVAVDAPVSVKELSQKITTGIDIRFNSLGMGYFRNNLTVLYSPVKNPTYKFVGYNPNTYPRTGAGDKQPIKFSDFIGYLNYFIPFPDPVISIRSLNNAEGFTDYSSNTLSATVYVDFRESQWPTPPRPRPGFYTYNRTVELRWYRDGVFLGSSVIKNATQAIPATSPDILPGSEVKDSKITLEVIATLYGPDDELVAQIKDQGNYPHAASSSAGAARYSVAKYIPTEPASAVKQIAANSGDVHVIKTVRRTIDGTPLGLSQNTIYFIGGGVGYTVNYDNALGRGQVDGVDFNWQRKATSGDWFNENLVATTASSWTDPAGYDSFELNNLNGHQIRFRARGKQVLDAGAEVNFGEYAYTNPITIQYLEQQASPIFEVRGTRKVVKGSSIKLTFVPYNMGALPKTYYWRIIPVPGTGSTNEFLNQAGSFTIAENLVLPGEILNNVNTGNINSDVLPGNESTRNYILEFYTNPSFSGEPIYESSLTTIFAQPAVEFSITYFDRDSGTTRKQSVLRNEIISTIETAVVTIDASLKNLPYTIQDVVYFRNTRTVPDSTGADDIYVDPNFQNSYSLNTNGGTFPLTCYRVDITDTDYIPRFRTRFKAISDAPLGGDAENFEQYLFELLDETETELLSKFSVNFYDKSEFFFDIVGTLESENAVIRTTNNVLTQAGSGLVKWNTYNQFTGDGQEDHYILNPGPDYDLSDLRVEEIWQYFDNDAKNWLFTTPFDGAANYLGDDLKNGIRFDNLTSSTINNIPLSNNRYYFRQIVRVVRVSDNFVLANKISNEATLQIFIQDTLDPIGLTAIFPVNPEERAYAPFQLNTEFGVRIMSYGFVGKTVRVQLSNNSNYWDNVAAEKLDFTVKITSSNMLVPLPDISNLKWYDNNASETITVSDASGSAAPKYTTRTVPFVIAQAPLLLAGKRVEYKRYHDSNTTSIEYNPGTIRTEEAVPFTIRGSFDNLPNGQVVRLFFESLTIGGEAKNNNLIPSFFNLTGYQTDSSGRPYLNVTPTHQYPNASTRDQKIPSYQTKNTITPVLYPNNERDVGVTIYFTDQDFNRLGSKFNVIAESYLPEPWDASNAEFRVSGRPANGVNEDGSTNDDLLQGYVYFWGFLSDPPPTSQQVFWRINASNTTAVDGVNYTGNLNDSVLSTDATGVTVQNRPGLRQDGGSAAPLYFPVLDDGVYKTTNPTLSVDMSLYSDFRTFSTGLVEIRNTNPAPIPAPTVNLPTLFNTQILYTYINAENFAAGNYPTGQTFRMEVNTDGTIKVFEQSYSTWLPSGENASNYEWKMTFNHNDSDLSSFVTTRLLVGNTGSAVPGSFNTWYSGNMLAIFDTGLNLNINDFTPATTAIRVDVRSKTNNAVKTHDVATLYYITTQSYTTPDEPVPPEEQPTTPDNPPSEPIDTGPEPIDSPSIPRTFER